jgi:filamentous hemagglutinin
MLAITEKVVDEIPIPQSVVKMDGNGNAVGDIVFGKTEKGWGFKKRSEFLEALSKSLANYPALRDKVLTLTKDYQNKFIDDFLKNADDNVLSQLNKDARILDGWKRLDGSPLRMETKYMELVRQLPNSYKYISEGDIVKVLNSSGEEIAELSKDVIKAKGGSIGSWNELLNKPPIANHKYIVDKYTYETDALGRVGKVKGKLDYTERGRNEYQQGLSVELKDGIKGQDYLPQKYNLYRGEWKSMEDAWAKAIQRGQKVEVEINSLFTGSSKRPSKFEVEFWIDGEYEVLKFNN